MDGNQQHNIMDKKLINCAVKALTIQAVYLREASLKLRRDFIPQVIEDDLTLISQDHASATGQFNIFSSRHGQGDASSKLVIFPFSAGVRCLPDGNLVDALENNPSAINEAVSAYVEITAEFAAYYLLNDSSHEEELQDALTEFGRFNVPYHVWPYWREYVQSTCGKVGIPPIPISMLYSCSDVRVKTRG